MLETTIDLIFKGNFSKINTTFLKELIDNSSETRFNTPEITTPSIDYSKVLEILKTNSYTDFVISTNNLNIKGKIVSNVFINLTTDRNDLELLLFFDVKDIAQGDDKKNIDFLRDWANSFQNKYSFEYVVCQMDNGNENEYYFDTNGLGPLYIELFI